MGYALARLAVTAIKNAGPHPDREKVKNVMNALPDQPTIIGNHNWTMDARRNPH
jgi:branched-chain amino acid transport system substrate-binding protein